ncbi:hypothetical protein BHM03_00011604, partial [Ensete ventricosum]
YSYLDFDELVAHLNMSFSSVCINEQGKHMAIVVCWLLGNGCLFSWNSMLTIEDYYVYLFPVEEDPKLKERLNNRQLLLQNIDYAVDMFLIYVLTLSIFPGFLSEDTGSHSLGSWYGLVLIAMYNVWDLIGRYIPLLKRFKLASRKGLMAAILSRFILVPAFYFTAKYGDQGWMILLTSFLGLSNGYLTVCVLTSAPKGYKVSLRRVGIITPFTL